MLYGVKMNYNANYTINENYWWPSNLYILKRFPHKKLKLVNCSGDFYTILDRINHSEIQEYLSLSKLIE